MALKNPGLLLYGYSINIANQFIDFKAASGGPVLTATIPIGNYSLSGLLSEIATQMGTIDPSNTYTVTANRSIAGGTQNRVTIATSGIFLSILFLTGPNNLSSIANVIGFNGNDYTGATTYSGSITTGSVVLPVMPAYTWVSPNRNQKVYGNVNVSATGLKETISFGFQTFFSMEFKYEPESVIDSVWNPFFRWAIQQLDLEWTPDITIPNTFYTCTLETTEAESQGLGFEIMEMLPDFPGLYRTGKLVFRQNVAVTPFIGP